MQLTDSLYIQSPPEVHVNAAETLCAVTRNAASPLATKLSSARFGLRYLSYEECFQWQLVLGSLKSFPSLAVSFLEYLIDPILGMK